MSIFIGSNAGETIEPGSVSSTVTVIGNPQTPSAGFDLIFAGGGNDRVAGGGGNDIAFLGGGNDLFTWNSGDGSDIVDGGSGTDTLAFNGSAAAETIRVSTGPLGTIRVSNNAEHANMTLTGMERIVISAGAGDDVVDASALPAGRAALELFGGLGNDVLIGSAGNDFFNGGDGNDLALMGAGDDSFVWNPGDDDDTLEGQAGVDRLLFNGANAAENIDIFANGGRVTFFRDIANVTMDLNDVERIDFNALGGADIIAVHDLAGTDVAEVNVNLNADGAADQVIANGTAGNDVIHAAASGSSASVTGLAAVTNVTNLEAIDQLIVDGQGGNDTLIGGAGSQVLRGGDGDDVISGGDGDDQMFGDAGNDRMIWNPGDDTDLVEGGDGVDTAEVNGGNGAEVFTATANGTRVRFDRLDPAPFSLDIGTTENLVVNMNGGNDSFSATGNLAALINITVDGGAGDDTILGSNGIDLLLGGDDNDFIDGQQGSDVAFLGAGDDTFQWDPGDGSDVVEGQDGFDTMLFNGSAGAEILAASANSGRVLFTRNLGNIVMDLDDVERIDVNALGNTDTVVVNDLSGTDVAEVNVNLAGTIGGTSGDGAADQVIVNGTSGNDVIAAVSNGSAASVTGLAAVTNVTNLEAIDQLIVDGQGGNDTLIGGAGSQVLRGGQGDDVISGGDGDDQMFGDAGNDRMVWNPGDDTDLMEGGDDVDTAEVNGGNGAEVFTATANGTRVRFDRLDPAPFSLDIGTTENLVVNMNGGDDQFSATGNLAALINITVDGGAGNDTILGSNGADLLLGGDDNDFIDGQQGNDVAFLGAGDDTFQWDPGDGSDVVEGQDGTDKLLFNGSAGAEILAASANGGRVLFTRNLGNIVMDLDDVERIDVNALGNTDTVVVNDLSGTDVVEVNLDLAGTIGGTAGDGAADQVIANATNGDDVIDVVGAGSSVAVLGLAARTNIANSEGANDSLVINALGGDDTITATTLPTGVIKLTIDGGAGDDTILGSQGADVFLGGAGDDFVFGDNGDDLAFLGADDDVFQWNPGDGNDTIEGQDGADTMRFFGANIAENIDMVANGGRVLFVRNIANVTMDLDDVETIDFRALGGADSIVIGDLSGTDVTSIGLDLRGPNGGGDAALDSVTVNATQGADVFGVAGDAGGVTVFGLQAGVDIFFADGDDRLTLNGLGGDDVINASSLEADGIKLTMNGGLGNDILIGGEGGDLFNGGDGNDVAFMGAGDDTFTWNPGDDNDTLEGQAGFDAMLFNGANVAESIDIFANGGRAIFFRNIANVTMDLNDVEAIDFNALGGADKVTIHDLSGTDVVEANVDLSGTLNGNAGDGAADQVIVNGTGADDVARIVGDAAGVSVLGLAAQVNITHAEGTLDELRVNGGNGDDVLDASELTAGAIKVVLDGGDGDDVIIGSDGDDVIIGGGGNDVIQDFTSGEDKIDLRGIAGADVFEWVLAHAKDAGGSTVIDFGDGDEITLANVTVGSLQADDFLFA